MIWLCTDTRVGIRAYFLDDEPVAISTQDARKSSEVFEWLSKEAFNKCLDYIKTLVINSIEPTIISLGQEIPDTYKLYWPSQIIKNHLNKALYNGEKVEIIGESYWRINSLDLDIKTSDGEDLTVSIRDLDFQYNLKD